MHPDPPTTTPAFPLVPLVAWRPHLAGLLAALGAALLTRPRTRAAGLVAAGAGLAGLAGVVGRARGTVWTPHPDDLTVLVANVWKQRADVAALAGLIRREAPDLVCLPEANSVFRDALAPHLPGYRAVASRPPGLRRTGGVTALVSQRMGEVTITVGDEMVSGPIAVTGGLLGERTFHAVHTMSPTTPSDVREWGRDLAVIGGWTRGAVAPIVAGDLNATLDHGSLRRALGRCRSAADLAGRALVGSFPQVAGGIRVPRPAGILIDHVLVPASAEITRYAVVDVPGSDHRGVLVSLRL